MFQNRLGSKHILLLTFAFFTVPGLICTVLVDGLIAKVTGIMLLWVYGDVALSLASVFANELLGEPFRNVSNSAFRIVHGLGGAFGTWMTFHLRDYRLIVGLFCAGYLVYNILLLFTLPQSPSFLLKQKRIAQLRLTITQIAVLNRIPEEQQRAVQVNLESIVQSGGSVSP